MKFFGEVLERQDSYSCTSEKCDWQVFLMGVSDGYLAWLSVLGTSLTARGSSEDEAMRALEDKVRVLKTKLEGMTRPIT